jgi:ABC-type transport system involved in cytochrome c biogenesis permease component
MLPLLLLPISIPAVTSMVAATTAVLTGEGSPVIHMKLLGAYCVVFSAAGYAMFDMVLNAE